jgi:hypothetical protein
MYQLRDQLLPGAALAGDQDVDVAEARDLDDLAQNRAPRWARADEMLGDHR